VRRYFLGFPASAVVAGLPASTLGAAEADGAALVVAVAVAVGAAVSTIGGGVVAVSAGGIGGAGGGVLSAPPHATRVVRQRTVSMRMSACSRGMRYKATIGD
jgi:hypothetical protein